MLAYYKNLFELSLRMAIVEFKVSVGETRLGIFWHLVGPAGMFLVIYGIFSRRLGADIPEYPLYLVFGIIIFRFFQNIISSSVSAVSVKRSVIKSINFPRPALVLSAVLKIIFFHAFDVLVIFLILAWFGHPVILMVLYPLVVGLVALFAFGAGLFVASVQIYIPDVQNIWRFVHRALWFATPIFYTVGDQGWLETFNHFNPLYYYIELARTTIVYAQRPSGSLLGGAVLFGAMMLVIGWLTFKKLEKKFAEFL